MNITVNKSLETVDKETLTVSEFIALKEIDTRAVAIAVNNKVAMRKEWDKTFIADGDAITVINAAFGG